jgi:glycosyltransferase involved in cell wall biosynthesis
MRVLQVVTDTDRRGAQTFASHLHDALAERGHDVETVALAPGRGSDRLDLPVLGRRRLAPRGVRTLRNRMRWSDVTVAHGSTTGIACAFVYRQIGDSRYWAPTWSRRLRVRATLRRARLVTALSPAAADTLVRYIGIDEARVRVVPNAVRVDAFSPATASERAAARAALGVGLREVPTVLFLGALSAEKGADLAIAATSRSADWDLVVVGDGPDRDQLERDGERLAPGRVHFLGTLSDPVSAYHAADVLVLPSRSEGMPATLIEAGLCALACVATNVGSVADVVLTERTGLLVEPGDLDGLTEALRRLTVDGELRDRVGAAARAHCRARFDLEIVTGMWEQVLAEASSSPPEGADEGK